MSTQVLAHPRASRLTSILLILSLLIGLNTASGAGPVAAEDKTSAGKASDKAKRSLASKSKRNFASARADEAQQVLQRYFACARPLNSEGDFEALRRCVNAQMFVRADKSRRDRFATWLLMSPQVDEVFHCADSDLGAAEYFSERTTQFVCFRFSIGEQTHTAVAFFKRDGQGKPGLYSFFY